MAQPASDDTAPRVEGQRWQMLLGCVVLAAVSVSLYGGAADFDFISYDDRIILLAHPELYAADSPIDAIVLSHFPREEPLLVRDLSWWLDAQLFGFESPRGYHIGNIAWNALAVVLFALWLFALRPDWRLALLPAALFAVIPVHVEPVAWVMGRKDLVSASFSLLVLIAHVVYLRATGPKDRGRRMLAYLGTFALYPVAVLGKFNALFLVPALLLQDIFFPYLTRQLGPTAAMPWRRLRAAALSLAPHLVVAVLLYLFYSWNVTQMGVTTHRGPSPLTAQHIGTLASFLPWVFALYLRNLADGSEHSISYAWPHTDLPMSTAELLGAAAIVLALLLAMSQLYRRRRDLFFFAAAFLVLMVPYANIVYIGIWIADRYVYLTSGLVIAALVWGAADVVKDRSRGLRLGAAGALAIVLLSWTASTMTRLPVFANDVSLFGREVELTNPTMFAYVGLARAKLRLHRAATTMPERAGLLASAEVDIERGIAHYESLPWRRDPDYLVGDHLYYSKLLGFSLLTLSARGAPPGRLLPLALRAHEVEPHPGSAEVLAQVLLQMCVDAPSDVMLARSQQSLTYFEEYISRSLALPTATSAQRDLLRLRVVEYYGRFPHLTSEVAIIEARLRE